ncbi:uncharacterized protein METZ01_LOCUS384551 [marine metagenome]|uniref:Uncharacterized protein n=1 Tax=marine metagenome TaxID=408172 RepID=A0A382UCE1_9ZZZZ
MKTKTMIDTTHIPWYHYCMVNRRVVEAGYGRVDNVVVSRSLRPQSSNVVMSQQALRLSPAPARDEPAPNYSGVEGSLLPVSVTCRVETGAFMLT